MITQCNFATIGSAAQACSAPSTETVLPVKQENRQPKNFMDKKAYSGNWDIECSHSLHPGWQQGKFCVILPDRV
jgi:hypothetical protein